MTSPRRTIHGPGVRARREAIKVSLRAFAADIQLSPSNLSRIEQGKQQPSPATATAIAERLRVSIDCISYASEETAA